MTRIAVLNTQHKTRTSIIGAVILYLMSTVAFSQTCPHCHVSLGVSLESLCDVDTNENDIYAWVCPFIDCTRIVVTL